jgi:hypothetical protein
MDIGASLGKLPSKVMISYSLRQDKQAVYLPVYEIKLPHA